MKKDNEIWEKKGFNYDETPRVKSLQNSLIDRSLTDRSGEWFVLDELDKKAQIVDRVLDDGTKIKGKYSDKSVIIRRARAIDAMLNAMTDGDSFKNTLTSEIFPDDLLLGTMTMGSNGLGKIFPNYLNEGEKRAGAITNRSSLSLFGHNSINYEDLVNKGLDEVIRKCDAGINKQKEEIKTYELKIKTCDENLSKENDEDDILTLKYARKTHEKNRDLKVNQQDFYQSVKISCQAVIDYAERFAQKAEDQIKFSTKQRGLELQKMADIARTVPRGKATNFREAVQSIWFFHLSLHASMNFISLGRLDQVLNPLLKKERKADYGKCLEIFECFLIKAAWRLNLDLSPSNIAKQDHVDNATVLGVNPYLIDQKAGVNNFLQNIIIGGVKPDGSDATNDCTYLILRAFRNVNLSTPGLYIRVGDKTPNDLKIAIADTWNTTKNNPAIINDKSMIPAMRKTLEQGSEATKKQIYYAMKGQFDDLDLPDYIKRQIVKAFEKELSEDDKERIAEEIYQNTLTELANDYCVDGCWEPILNGKSDWTFSMLCALTPLECALNEGAMLSNDPELLRGEKRAPRSAKPTSFDTLMQAFSQQLNFFMDQNITSLFLYYMMDEYACPSPLLSTYIDGCMEYGRDKSWAGARYNIGGVIMSGVPDVVNTLAAIKKWVLFDDQKTGDKLDESINQKYDLDLVIDALRNNFICGNPLDTETQDLFDKIKIDFRTNSPTFGNNDSHADEICQKVLDCYELAVTRSSKFAKATFQNKPEEDKKNEIIARRSISGYYGKSLEERFGFFNMMISAGLGTFEQYNWSGKGNAASADRLRGEPLAPNFSPVSGTVHNGIAGITETLGKLSLERFAGGVITDMCVEKPSNPQGELEGILEAFIEAKGGMMTLTIGDKELYTKIYQEIIAAQKVNSPELTQQMLKQYAHVNVRIGGWQTPFVTLPFSHMKNYIHRPVEIEEFEKENIMEIS